jgi:ABC-type nitrate/sulfonate/bicarbonate transport system substrate-binding protein
LSSVEALADQKLVGRKAVIAATAIGSGTYVYGVYVLKNTKAADGKPVNDSVEWVGGGGDLTMLAGLKGAKFDAIMAVPEWQSKAVAQGFGQPIYDVQDEKDTVNGGIGNDAAGVPLASSRFASSRLSRAVFSVNVG